ncbi:hypothetical protein MBAV_000078 [Candidatus Magnetobacterium bavaricum]|uniref:Uncharacterized protein n=1 Tax=Candidatus Magnetobacterium bavaricum TaxID=29290 RepID=A0A0F3H0U0_9BACT|nr:hypothetical protein MBAV_000078 [Candidatus Magnetobacterium bavaricum]
MCTQLFILLVVCAFAHEVEVKVRQHRLKRVRVIHLRGAGIGSFNPYLVGEEDVCLLNYRFKNPLLSDPGCMIDLLGCVRAYNKQLLCIGVECPYDNGVLVVELDMVHAKDAKWV